MALLPVLGACTSHHGGGATRSGDANAATVPLTATPMRYASAPGAVLAPPDPSRRAKLTQLVPRIDRLLGASIGPHLPGLAVGIVLDGEVVYARGFGYRDVAAKAAFDIDSQFRIASVTKGFAAMAILKLRDEGKLQLDAPAARYYPPLAELAYPTRDSTPITVRDLLTHGSGLPEDNYWVDAGGDVTDAKLARMIAAGMTFSRAPNTHYEYSNTDYALVGKVIQGVTGTPARDYIRSEILLPLGMTSSVWSREETAPDRLAVGYRGEGAYHENDARQVVAPITPLGVYDTAGGLYSSIRDMTRYLAFQLSAWPARDGAEAGPIRRSSVREMQQGARRADPGSFPRVLLPSRRPAVVRANGSDVSLFSFSYGFGFFTATTCEDDFYVHHDGELPGYETTLAFYPARGYGIVTFINDELAHFYPADEVTDLLREAGVIDVPEPAPVPALDAARLEAEELLARWDGARAQRLFEPTFWHYQTPAAFRERLAALTAAHGDCHVDGSMKVTNLTRGSWRVACERGEITFVAVLSPEASPRLQTLLWEDSLPPSALLERTAAAVASWVNRWDDGAARTILAPSMDARKARRTLARIAVDHGECKVDHALVSDGATTAKFRLACTEGAVDLALTVDAATGRVTKLGSALPRTLANCAQ